MSVSVFVYLFFVVASLVISTTAVNCPMILLWKIT